eukprot:3608549-Prymnesium_polylepis.1
MTASLEEEKLAAAVATAAETCTTGYPHPPPCRTQDTGRPASNRPRSAAQRERGNPWSAHRMQPTR